jgi:hypothetical protein
MSLFSNLFHRHQAATPQADLIDWPGESGTKYTYQILPIDSEFRPVPGNYIYARQAEDGTWVPIYIAQTRAMSQRLEGRTGLAEAMAQGATHIHVHLGDTGQSARCSEEHDLLELWHPACNAAAV